VLSLLYDGEIKMYIILKQFILPGLRTEPRPGW